VWANYFLPTGYFTKKWQLPGHFQQNDLEKQQIQNFKTKKVVCVSNRQMHF